MQVVQGYVGYEMSLWSYNSPLKAWEPVVEPWSGILNCDANSGGRMMHGIRPGVHLTLKASSEAIFTTVSFAALSSLITAAKEWEVRVGETGGAPARAALGLLIRRHGRAS